MEIGGDKGYITSQITGGFRRDIEKYTVQFNLGKLRHGIRN